MFSDKFLKLSFFIAMHRDATWCGAAYPNASYARSSSVPGRKHTTVSSMPSPFLYRLSLREISPMILLSLYSLPYHSSSSCGRFVNSLSAISSLSFSAFKRRRNCSRAGSSASNT